MGLGFKADVEEKEIPSGIIMWFGGVYSCILYLEYV